MAKIYLKMFELFFVMHRNAKERATNCEKTETMARVLNKFTSLFFIKDNKKKRNDIINNLIKVYHKKEGMLSHYP